MKTKLFRSTLAWAAVLSMGIFVFAQHGHPGGVGVGGGLGAGAGAGLGANAGAGMSAGIGHANAAGLAGMGNARLGAGMSAGQMGSSAPSRVLANAHLNTSLTAALGKSGISIPGGNLQTACSGFKTLGSCVAAMHVAQNLNVPFASLQSQMTGSGAVSLGKAIRNLGGPAVTSKKAAKKAAKTADKQAGADLRAAAHISAQASS